MVPEPMSGFDRDIAVIGAGRIGLPWAAVLATSADWTVTCVDIDKERVASINAGDSPFEEPGLEERLEHAVGTGRLQASTDPGRVTDHTFVALTVNAPRRDLSQYVDVVKDYADYLVDGQTVICRTTLPADMVGRTQEILARAEADVGFCVFPERLAEGKAVEEILSLPKVIGSDNPDTEARVRALLEPLECPIQVTDPKTAMFVKLIDNGYRDAVFAIANQIAYTADQLGLNAHEAIELANHEYPRNDIPTPGTVGGKCLPKDPHFLTDERVCDQPTTPDLFNMTRRTNAALPSYITTAILRRRPDTIGVLGLAYKRGVGDTFGSPAAAIADSLADNGVEVQAHDPHVAHTTNSVTEALTGADGALLAVNHPEFDDIGEVIGETLPEDGFVYDIWGMLDPTTITQTYEGLGLQPSQ